MRAFGIRLVWYVGVTVLACWVAGGIGVSYFDATCDENDPEATECDLAGLYAIWFAFLTLVGCVVLATVTEAVVALRRRSRPTPRPEDS